MTTRKPALLTTLPLLLMMTLAAPESLALSGDPEVHEIRPIEGAPGDLIRILGSGLGGGEIGMDVTLVPEEGHKPVRLRVESWKDEAIEARIPNRKVRPGLYEVFVHIGDETCWAEQAFWIRGPEIVAFDEQYAAFGILGIQARYVGWKPKVKIGKKAAKVVRVESISPSGRLRRIVVRIPRGLRPTLHWVQVKTKTGKAKEGVFVGSAKRLGKPRFEMTVNDENGNELFEVDYSPKWLVTGIEQPDQGHPITVFQFGAKQGVPANSRISGFVEFDAPTAMIYRGRVDIGEEGSIGSVKEGFVVERIGDCQIAVRFSGEFEEGPLDSRDQPATGRYVLNIDPRDFEF